MFDSRVFYYLLIIVLKILIVPVFFLIVVFVFILIGTPQPPKHSDLVSQFYQHREVYEELVRMAHEDHLEGVFHYGDLFENSFQLGDSELAGINVERAERYKTLMTSSNTPSIFLRESLNVIIPIESFGWVNDGWRITFERFNTKPKNLLTNLDLFKNESDEWEYAYSHIEDDWYLGIIW